MVWDALTMASVRLQAWLFFGFAALGGLYAFSQQTLVDQDLWGHLAFGRAFYESGHVTSHDPYSYMPTHPWINHEWLCEAFLYRVLVAFGSPGLLLWKAVAGAGIALCLTAAARLRGAPLSWPLFLCTLLCMHGLQYNVHVRPYVVSYFMFALFIYLLELASTRMVWLLVPFSCLWANCHASFVMGLGLIVLYMIERAIRREWPVFRRLALVLLAATAITTINPYGIAYWQFVLHAVFMERPYITEFQPLPWDADFPPFFWECKILLILAPPLLIVDSVRKRRIDVSASAILIVTAFLALQHYRHVPLFVMAALAFLPAMFGDRFLALPILVPSLAGVIFAALVLTQPWHLRIPITPTEGGYAFPLRALGFIEQNHVAGRCLNYFDWGEMLIWDDPNVKVAFDGRLETVYTAEAIHQNLDFTAGRPAGLMLSGDLEPDFILTLTSSGATRFMRAQSDWLAVYEDPLAVMFLPRSAARQQWMVPPPCEGNDIVFDRWLELHRCAP